MEKPIHDMTHLFAQLGLPSDSQAVEQFIATHSPLPHSVLLADATFWTAAQAEFLREGTASDADWADVIDALNSGLADPPISQ